ncbi:MAG: hypothetical protein RMJ67_08920 [Elusimicrobiota bacterium]|nr:hypothetical protein [Endomicrobiia bacterium]MDW8166618.1 hypothetical protein [Elusimicrobiota bacterium]
MLEDIFSNIPPWVLAIFSLIFVVALLLPDKKGKQSVQVIYPYTQEYLQYALESKRDYYNFLIKKAEFMKDITIKQIDAIIQKQQIDAQKEVALQSLQVSKDIAGMQQEIFRQQQSADIFKAILNFAGGLLAFVL